MTQTRGVVLAGALALFSTMAAEASPDYVWYWTGKAGDGMWNNTTNWVKAAGSWTPQPNWGDTVVFTNDQPLSLSFATFGDTSYRQVRKFKFKGSAPVYPLSSLSFGGGATDSGKAWTMDTCPELFVDAGSEVVCSNGVDMYNGGPLWKTGAGKIRIISSAKRTSQSPEGWTLAILGGEWIAELEPGNSYGCYNHNTNVTVAAGAAFELHGYNSMGGKGIWHVDGTLRLNGSGGETSIGTLTGTGRVERVAGASGTFSSTTLSLYPGTVGPQTFSGTFDSGMIVRIRRRSGLTDDAFVALLSNADTFKDTYQLYGDLNALRFAPGIGDFYIKDAQFTSAANLVLSDTNGAPANVHIAQTESPANMSLGGGGDFFTSTDLALAGTVVTNTGRLVLENSAALTVGDETAANDVDLSSLKGIVMTGGTIRFQNTVLSKVASISGTGGSFQATHPVLVGDYFYQGRYGAGSDVTIQNCSVTSNASFYPGIGSLTISNGVFHGTPAVGKFSSYPNTKHPVTVQTRQGDTALTLAGGEAWLYDYSGDTGYGHLRSVLVNGGATLYSNYMKSRQAATAENPDTVTFDGGALGIPTEHEQYGISLPYSGSASTFLFRIGAKGARVFTQGVRNGGAPEVEFAAPFEPAPGVTDGGISFFPRMSIFRFDCPVSLAGGMTFTEGKLPNFLICPLAPHGHGVI